MQENIDSCAKTLNLFSFSGALFIIQLHLSGLEMAALPSRSAEPYLNF